MRDLTETELAEELGLTPGTLRNWRVRGVGPPFYKAGRAVRYTRVRVDTWKLGQERSTKNG